MTILFDVILPVFIVIGFGYLVAWRKMFTEVAVDGLMRFAQNFAVPVLLFTNVARLDLAANFNLGMWIAFYTGAFLSYFLGWAVSRFYLKRSPEDAVAIGFCCLFSNSLLLGIPIMERAYGTQALAGNFAIIALHSPMFYTFGIIAMELARARGRPTRLGQILPQILRGILSQPLVIGIAMMVAVIAAIREWSRGCSEPMHSQNWRCSRDPRSVLALPVALVVRCGECSLFLDATTATSHG